MESLENARERGLGGLRGSRTAHNECDMSFDPDGSAGEDGARRPLTNTSVRYGRHFYVIP